MWQGIEGHDDVVEHFRRALARGRLASTFLFVGLPGIGKHAFALKLAQSLLCQRNPEAMLEPCGQCDSCIQVSARTHPDLLLVSKPTDKSFIPLSAFVGDEQRRMREGLCHDIALRAYMGGRKVAIIDDADYLNEEGANSLLKTLEEPPPRSVLILVGTSADKQLPTIRSRTQIIRFRPLEPTTIANLLLAEGIVEDPASAERLAQHSGGSFSEAVVLSDESLWQFRGELLTRLARGPGESVTLAREVNEFVEAAGKEAPVRRNRLRQVIGMAIEFYRQLLRTAGGLAPTGDDALRRAVLARVDQTPDAEKIAAALERSLDALGHVDRNAHQPTLVDCWLDDLARNGV